MAHFGQHKKKRYVFLNQRNEMMKFRKIMRIIALIAVVEEVEFEFHISEIDILTIKKKRSWTVTGVMYR